MLQFYEVVPVAMLLDVLAGDVPAVAQRVQRLVLPFYFSGAHRMLVPLSQAMPAHSRPACPTILHQRRCKWSQPDPRRLSRCVEHGFILRWTHEQVPRRGRRGWRSCCAATRQRGRRSAPSWRAAWRRLPGRPAALLHEVRGNAFSGFRMQPWLHIWAPFLLQGRVSPALTVSKRWQHACAVHSCGVSTSLCDRCWPQVQGCRWTRLCRWWVRCWST